VREIDVDEEILEVTHPDDPGIVVRIVVPERVAGLRYGESMGSMHVEPILGADKQPIVIDGKLQTREVYKDAPLDAMLDKLGELIRDVSGITLKKKGQPYVPKDGAEWARVLTRKQFDYTRPVPVRVWLDGEVPKDPDSGLRLKKNQYRLAEDPNTKTPQLFVWDDENDRPAERPRKHMFWQTLLDQSIRRGAQGLDGDAGKDSPTSPSA
jgi:hypothetical protein